jgi:hypothetical protein
MVRWIVIGAVGVIVFTIYALVDLFMTHTPRVRAFPKPIWIFVIVALPVVGPLLWLFVGKATNGRKKPTTRGGRAPDDDPLFLGNLDREGSDERIRRLEEELRKLDDEALNEGGAPDTTTPKEDTPDQDTPDQDTPDEDLPPTKS